ncbi:MAG: substrate-binding domain-containing protein [Desulfitobacteriia bacterium]|jgi:putative molybdopterin biosynthesis protein
MISYRFWKGGITIEQRPPLTPEEAAKILKISKYTLYELIKRGEIPSRRIGRKIRIDQDSLAQYLKGGSTPKEEKATETKSYGQSGMNSTKGSFRFIGSHDPVVELLGEFIKHSPTSFSFSTSFKGSMDGLIALYRRETEITGIHLWDSKTKDYNIPYIKHILLFEPLFVVNLVQRTQGWIVQANNPLKISSWDDLARKDLRFINRQKGSGTRLRIDQYLSEHNIPPSQVSGYDKEENTHLGVAMKIANGEGNAGIGVQASAQKMGLDFIPLFKERYDLVVLQETAETPEWQQIFTILNSPAFHRAIEQYVGYDASLTGKVMYQTT